MTRLQSVDVGDEGDDGVAPGATPRHDDGGRGGRWPR